MAEGKYEKHFVRHPKILDWLPHHGAPKPKPGEKGSQYHVIFMDKQLMPKAHKHIMINWFKGMPAEMMGRGYVEEFIGVPQHKHPHDEIILAIGSNPDNYDDLGAELEIAMGPEQEKYIVNTTTAIYIPGNMLHCPLVWKKITRPHLLVVLSMGDAYE
jgi:hypothetical protein